MDELTAGGHLQIVVECVSLLNIAVPQTLTGTDASDSEALLLLQCQHRLPLEDRYWQL